MAMCSGARFPLLRQVQLHLGMGTDPAGIVSWHKKHGIQLQAYSVLGNTAVSHKASASAELRVPLHQQHAGSMVITALLPPPPLNFELA